MGFFSIQIEAPDSILILKRRNLQNFSDSEFQIPVIPEKFQIPGISQISLFKYQNWFWGFNLSGKSALFGQNDQIWLICEEIPEIPKNSRILETF